VPHPCRWGCMGAAPMQFAIRDDAILPQIEPMGVSRLPSWPPGLARGCRVGGRGQGIHQPGAWCMMTLG
jgi:hypothetical protein